MMYRVTYASSGQLVGVFPPGPMLDSYWDQAAYDITEVPVPEPTDEAPPEPVRWYNSHGMKELVC